MDYLGIIGTVAFIHLLAVISPGPDFVMAVRNSLAYSRRTGIFTAVGFGLGIAVHISYSLAGLALVISKSILLFNLIKYLGAAYLIYIGIKSLLSKKSHFGVSAGRKAGISAFSAVRMGFLTNVLNPKATLFFLSLFTFVISPNTPVAVMLAASAIMIVNTVLWFSLVAVFLTNKRISSKVERFQNKITKLFGAFMILLGVKVALSDR